MPHQDMPRGNIVCTDQGFFATLRPVRQYLAAYKRVHQLCSVHDFGAVVQPSGDQAYIATERPVSRDSSSGRHRGRVYFPGGKRKGGDDARRPRNSRDMLIFTNTSRVAITDLSHLSSMMTTSLSHPVRSLLRQSLAAGPSRLPYRPASSVFRALATAAATPSRPVLRQSAVFVPVRFRSTKATGSAAEPDFSKDSSDQKSAAGTVSGDVHDEALRIDAPKPGAKSQPIAKLEPRL